MPGFEKSDLLIGHPIIDSQHGRLFALIDELRVARDNADPLVEYRLTCKALYELVDYTRVHFEEEERLMREANYPGYDGHKREHENFARLIGDVEEDMHLGTSVLSVEFFCDLLEKWLREHILEIDRQYVPYLVPAANAAA